LKLTQLYFVVSLKTLSFLWIINIFCSNGTLHKERTTSKNFMYIFNFTRIKKQYAKCSPCLHASSMPWWLCVSVCLCFCGVCVWVWESVFFLVWVSRRIQHMKGEVGLNGENYVLHCHSIFLICFFKKLEKKTHTFCGVGLWGL
jgi:hypothetical protein